jgi:D-alanine-D-alanine ligase
MDRLTHALYLNEINTLPEFTRNSVYPKLLESEGKAFEDVVDTLIRLAFQE